MAAKQNETTIKKKDRAHGIKASTGYIKRDKRGEKPGRAMQRPVTGVADKKATVKAGGRERSDKRSGT